MLVMLGFGSIKYFLHGAHDGYFTFYKCSPHMWDSEAFWSIPDLVFTQPWQMRHCGSLFFSCFSLLLLRVMGRGCHTLLKPYETICNLWIWAIQIQFDWLIVTVWKPYVSYTCTFFRSSLQQVMTHDWFRLMAAKCLKVLISGLTFPFIPVKKIRNITMMRQHLLYLI